MQIDVKKILSIYATIGIPILYLYNIYLAYAYPHTLHLTLALNLLGICIAVLGAVIWVVSYINLGLSFGVLPQKQKRITRGLYKYVHHPMYMGIWCTFVGLSLANESLAGLLFATLITTPLLFFRASIEEKHLE